MRKFVVLFLLTFAQALQAQDVVPWNFERHCIAGVWSAEDTILKVERSSKASAGAACAVGWRLNAEVRNIVTPLSPDDASIFSCGAGLGIALNIHRRHDLINLVDDAARMEIFARYCIATAIHPSLQAPERQRLDLR